jgi:hypothetical protein
MADTTRADWSPAMQEAWAEFQRDLDAYITGYKDDLRRALADRKAEAEPLAGAQQNKGAEV